MRGCPHGRGTQTAATTDSSRVHQGVQARRGRAGRSTGRPIAVVARELGIYDSTLGNWVRQDRIDRGEAEGLTTQEQARLRQLEAENAKLRMERDLLKRTVAFWVTEQSTP
jgi:transposase